jgi:hypothetical protein
VIEDRVVDAAQAQDEAKEDDRADGVGPPRRAPPGTYGLYSRNVQYLLTRKLMPIADTLARNQVR